MKGGKSSMLLIHLSCILLSSGFNGNNALSYDHSATIECLETPYKLQYRGGIIVNPELDDGLKGWSTFGDAKLEHRELGGNKFIVARERTKPYSSISQKLYLQKDKFYTLSAWIQVSEGTIPVTAVFKTSAGFKKAGVVIAKSSCWSMLKGGVVVDASGPTELYFESNTTSVELWVDSISLQPFTKKQWKSHQDQMIEKARTVKVRIQAVDKHDIPLSNAKITIKPNKLSFPFGCAINKNIISNTAYQNWFTLRFTVTSFENEMKWYSIEPTQGHEDYSIPDAMVEFAKKNGISVRGHNIVWDDPMYQPQWVNSLSPSDLNKAVETRINSITSRYKGQVIGWDVVNENLHFSFFESKLGPNASAVIYNMVQKVDGTTTLFMNDYNTIEESGDDQSTPPKYLEKLKNIQAFPGNINLHMGIGLESHFDTPNLPYIRSSIDTLAATNFPIWLTEVDVKSGPNQAHFLDQILREAHAHPKVAGIVIWSAWKPEGCYRMCLTDNNFKNLPTGDVVDKLLQEWGGGTLVGTTDANGFFEATLFHGEYNLIINYPYAINSSSHQKFDVAPMVDAVDNTYIVQFNT